MHAVTGAVDVATRYALVRLHEIEAFAHPRGPSRENEWGPWNVEQRVVTTMHSCRPCGIDGCGSGKVSDCLTLLPVDAVHAAARELLARAA